ncbi:MAG: hypothetical protein ACRDRN_05950 [Sciscionella sp.]
MGKAADRADHIDPDWPEGDGHPVSEFATELTGALSPFGDIDLPLTEVAYDHPQTEINR